MLRRPRPVLAAGLTALAVLAPVAAYAAPVTSRADAEALTVAVAGQGSGTGTVEATYDGEETVTGEQQPTPQPFAQQFVDLGVLTQQATAGNGSSAACAGVAGAGGGVIQIGDGSCLAPGETVQGSLTDLSLGALGLQPPSEGQLPPELTEALAPILGPITDGSEELDGIIADAIGQVDEQVGPLGLSLGFDAIEGRCAVSDGSPSGSASITNAALTLSGGGQQIEAISLPANPAPNTRVVTDLSSVVDLVLGAVDTQLNEGLDGATAPLAAALAPVREQLVAGIRDNIQDQLAPLEDNVLRITLNEQSNPTSDSIRVTALHAEVLPVAAEQLDAALVDARVGAVGCGPADRVVADEEDPQPAPAPPASKPRLPTAVSAGVAGESDGQGGPGAAAYGLLALGTAAAGAVGWSAWRRRSALHG